MSMAIGLIGILIGIVLLNWLSFKGWSMCYIAIGAAVLVAVFNLMNPQGAYVEVFMSGASNILVMTYPILLTGSLFAAVFSMSGAAVTIARFLLRLFASKGVQGARGCWVVSTVSVVFFTLMQLGGVDAMAVQITMLPIIISLLRECNLTRKGIPLLLMATYSVGAMPYAPHMLNTIPMSILGTDSGAFAVPASSRVSSAWRCAWCTPPATSSGCTGRVRPSRRCPTTPTSTREPPVPTWSWP